MNHFAPPAVNFFLPSDRRFLGESSGRQCQPNGDAFFPEDGCFLVPETPRSRRPGMPSALMPFYVATADEAASQLVRWLTLAHRKPGETPTSRRRSRRCGGGTEPGGAQRPGFFDREFPVGLQ